MTSRILVLCRALTLTSALLHPHTLRAQSLSAVPRTPAGNELLAWLDAYNDGDSSKVADYIREHQPAQVLRGSFAFRPMSGGFDLLGVERSEERHIEFIVRHRRDSMTAYGVLDVSSGEPPRVTDAVLEPLGPAGSVADLRIDASIRARVVKRTAALMDSFYVDSNVARRMADSLRARLARGGYDSYQNGASLAVRLDRDLAAIARDKHLKLFYSARRVPPDRPTSAGPGVPPAEEIERERRDLEARNCGFRRAEQLDDNVGYLRLDMFAKPEVCEPTAAAAMSFVAGTRALIIDLRENGGGTPGMVALVASYLFDRRTHLNDRWTRQTGRTEEYWTQDSVPGLRFGAAKPVYVLTSTHTFSAAEEFAYDLKVLGRATIVGETSGGGAHPTQMRRIEDHFLIGVPYAKAVNPITHTNWEGTGVEPSVKVPAAMALDTARAIIRQKSAR